MQLPKIREIFISERVAAKLWSKHAVSEDEVFEVFENEDEPPKLRRSNQVPGSYLVYGRTLAGRYLVVALFPKPEGRANVASARDMIDIERRRFKSK